MRAPLDQGLDPHPGGLEARRGERAGIGSDPAGRASPPAALPLRLGYFVPEFPGQTHIFFWRELRALRDLGVLPEIVSTRLPDRSIISHVWAPEAEKLTHYLYPPGLRALGGSLWTQFRAGPRGWWKCLRTLFEAEGSWLSRLKLLPWVLMGAQLGWLARRRRWAHVHVHSCGNAALVALFAHQLTGLSYSLTLHGPLRDYGPHQKLKWARSAFGLVITRRLRAELEQDLRGHLPLVLDRAPMGVELERFQPPERFEPWSGTGPCRLFACGRLNPCKGHDDLVRALAQIRRRGIDAQLEIAGADDTGGSTRQALEQLAGELGVTSAVKLLGAVSEETLKEGLRRAHVFVLGSHEEPLGVAIMEAMAMKVPVVVTGAGGVAELVDADVDGILVPPRAPEELARGILRVLENPDLARRMGEAGRRKIETSYHSRVSAEVLLRSVRPVPEGEVPASPVPEAGKGKAAKDRVAPSPEENVR